MKPGTLILGGMLTSMCTWSGIRCPSIVSTPFHWQRFLRISPQFLAVLAADGLSSMLWAKHDVVLAHPLGVRKAVRLLCHCVLLPLAAGDLNNHHPRGGGVSLHSIVAIHPHSGWIFVPHSVRHRLKPLAECPGVSPGIPLLTDYATSSIITMMSADPTRSVGVRTTPIHSTLRIVAEMGSAVDSSAVLSEPISATPCI